MLEITCTAQESAETRSLLSSIAAEHDTIDSPDFLLKATPLSHELPRRLREIMNEFRLRDDGYGVLVIHGFPLDDEKIGPTPSSWDDRSIPSRTLEEELFLALCGTLLGDLVSWSSEQDGYLSHNVLPIKEHEKSQLGWGSDIEFIYHVEDAFSPYSPDYLGLMCMRNPDSTGTTVSAVADLDLAKLDLDTLFGENFVVRPDDAHLEKAAKENNYNSYRRVAQSNREEEVKNPTKTVIFFGDRESPYIRLDPPYMGSNGCVKSQEALENLLRNLNANKTQIRLRPGDIVFIDNCRVVHGREPFKARYDGTDRWLKRVKVTRDLRKSRQSRSPAISRKII
jgi:Fe(II)/alpha-ketoglutarate-dependent arginine beta-hydroxylase